MSRPKFVQGDRLPPLVESVVDRQTGQPIDFSAPGDVVRFKFRPVGSKTLKSVVVCQKLPGIEVVDPYTGQTKVDESAPYDVPGRGGRFAVEWAEDDLDTPGYYEGEAEITFASGAQRTEYRLYRFQVREQFEPGQAVAPVQFSQHPASAAVADGAQVAFTAAATGTPPITLQWQRNGADIPGATAATLEITATLADNGAVYRAVATNAAGSATSNAATLTVTPIATAIATQPQPRTINDGQQATFFVVATGSAPLAYQWRRNGANIAGATSATLSFTPLLADSGAQYSVAVFGPGGAVTSTAAALTVNPVAPSIALQPASTAVNEGSVVTFGVQASGSAPLAYQWTRNGADIAGATGSTYTLTAAFADTGAAFAVRVTNSFGAATSTAATLTVAEARPAWWFATAAPDALLPLAQPVEALALDALPGAVRLTRFAAPTEFTQTGSAQIAYSESDLWGWILYPAAWGPLAAIEFPLFGQWFAGTLSNDPDDPAAGLDLRYLGEKTVITAAGARAYRVYRPDLAHFARADQRVRF